ncbi:MAG: alcohol dehydrogenase catalytic domain-containing protein [Actinomycetota bacterium]|nr:alcohol dehydrogenase catalytic domain-containing protein [Actinomycetota bacterium]
MKSDIIASAAVLVEFNKIQIEELEVPSLGRGQVLVKVEYCGLCRSQLMEYRGFRGPDKWLPHLFGHEGYGTVLEIGEGVTKVSPGTNVVMGWIEGSGLSAPGPQYRRKDGSTVNAGQIAAMSTHAVVSESRLTAAPVGLPPDVGVLFGCCLLTGAGIVMHELDAPRNACIVLIGIGGVGLSALMTLVSLKYSNLIVIDASQEKLEFARKLGVKATYLASDIEKSNSVLQHHGDIDFVIESAGRVETIELGFRLVKKFGGKVIFASHPPTGTLISIDPFDLICGKEIRGSWGGSAKPDQDIPILFSLLTEANMPLKSLIPKRYRLSEIELALNDLELGKVFRPLIDLRSGA